MSAKAETSLKTFVIDRVEDLAAQPDPTKTPEALARKAIEKQRKQHAKLSKKAFKATGVYARVGRLGNKGPRTTAWHTDTLPLLKDLPKDMRLQYKLTPFPRLDEDDNDSTRLDMRLVQGKKKAKSGLALFGQPAVFTVEDQTACDFGVVMAHDPRLQHASPLPHAINPESPDFALLEHAIDVVWAGEKQRGEAVIGKMGFVGDGI